MQDELILNNLNLIHFVIRRMNLRWENDDEYQEYYDAGLEGLIRGAAAYESSRGVTQSTYLSKCIRHSIARFLYLKTIPKRYNKFGKDISLDTPIITEYGDDFCISDIIQDESIDIEQEIINKEIYEDILNALNHVRIEEDKICFKYYFGIGLDRQYTYTEIGNILGVSKNAIYLRVKRAIKQVKQYLISRGYKEEICITKDI